MRKSFRKLLVVALLLSAVFAAWSWLRPYEWGADDGARCRIVGCQVKQDRSNFWLDVHLKMAPGEEHDLRKPVVLRTAAGREIEPADTTMVGDDENGTRQLWFKFWLEAEDLSGPLNLQINDGELNIRSGEGLPSMRSDGSRYLITNRW